ncbi:hypothetical protein BKA66DRAFT_9357 [Pyrenochaeta sp. MPI-SDFR-AT-0127]|nr:hypothetical protein BKA66DRAFT_9357 [Pyrenochaeta sp. MPI-SDFR-AT-0127]
MKSILLILSSLGVLALAQDIVGEVCQCPEVKCPAYDVSTLCQCLNNKEFLCTQRCPDYRPRYRVCPPAPPSLTLPPLPTPTLPICQCEQVYCLQAWPESCHCANNAAQKCFEKCGGVKPVLQVCPTTQLSARAPVPETAPEPIPEPEPAKTCMCEQIFCVQMWPDSCYCANAAAERCYKKCGGTKPELQICPPQTSKTLSTKFTTKPAPTPTKSTSPTNPTNTHKVCGGGRANYLTCDEGYACITDPYTPGCGPACDGLGICVKDKMCGGFAGFPCEHEDQVCHDDPRDDCDPKNGGADCAGVCVWPHKSLYGDEV